MMVIPASWNSNGVGECRLHGREVSLGGPYRGTLPLSEFVRACGGSLEVRRASNGSRGGRPALASAGVNHTGAISIPEAAVPLLERYAALAGALGDRVYSRPLVTFGTPEHRAFEAEDRATIVAIYRLVDEAKDLIAAGR